MNSAEQLIDIDSPMGNKIPVPQALLNMGRMNVYTFFNAYCPDDDMIYLCSPLPDSIRVMGSSKDNGSTVKKIYKEADFIERRILIDGEHYYYKTFASLSEAKQTLDSFMVIFKEL